MSRKKRSHKEKPTIFTDFFGMHHNPTVETGSSSDDKMKESRAWVAERERQKTVFHEAAIRGQQKVQIAALLDEENDHRTHLITNEKNTRRTLEEAMFEQRINHEWMEFQIAVRKEREQREYAKKASFTQIATQQMLHRANIVDRETENRIAFFNSFTALMNKAKETEKARVAAKEEKLEADRKKAAERAKAFEERARKIKTEKSSLFQLVNVPAAPEEPKTKTEQAGSWLSGWFSKT